MKPIITKLCMLTAMLLICLSASAYDFVVNGIYYNIQADNKSVSVTYRDTNYNSYSGNVVIPDVVEYNGEIFDVVAIEANAFRESSGMEYIEIGSKLTKMDNGAFKACSGLKTIKFNDSELELHIGRYEVNKIYAYFRDCPLKTVYIGRYISWESPGVNFENYYPFKTVTKAIFNTPDAAFGGFDKLIDAYIGPRCSKFGCGTKIQNIYIFNNDIQYAYAGNNNANIYVIDNNNIPDKVKNLTSKQIQNLIGITAGLQYEYGTYPSIDKGNITFNIPDMTISVDENSISKDVGTYTQGIPFNLSDELWETCLWIPFSYTITPATIMVIANNATKEYGVENPEFSCSFFGFKYNETQEVLTKYPQIGTTANIDSPVGTYPIIPTNAEADNYTFNYERGTLTIVKANQEIEWDQRFDNVSAGDIIELTAISTSGLPVKYSVSDESIAEIFSQGGKKYVEFLKTGTVSIRANQEGNENYNEADRVSKKIILNSIITEIIPNKTSLDLKEGESDQISIEIKPINASNKILKWESSNPDVATVDDNGNIVAIANGSTIITVSTTDGSNLSRDINVFVSVLSAIDIISAGAENINVYVDNGTINIEKPQEYNVYIYTLQGKLIKETPDSIIANLNKGVYIVRIANKIFKIAL